MRPSPIMGASVTSLLRLLCQRTIPARLILDMQLSATDFTVFVDKCFYFLASVCLPRLADLVSTDVVSIPDHLLAIASLNSALTSSLAKNYSDIKYSLLYRPLLGVFMEQRTPKKGTVTSPPLIAKRDGRLLCRSARCRSVAVTEVSPTRVHRPPSAPPSLSANWFNSSIS